jgi:hypothetical protein
MPNDFVTLITTSVASEAEAVRLLLEREGIKAFIADANIMTANWFLGPAVGFVKLQVAKSRAEEAMEVLRRHPRSERLAFDAEERPATCLACGAAMPEDTDRCPQCGWSFQAQDPQDQQDESEEDVPPLRYHYTVPYEPDIHAALDKLRQTVFESNDFNGAEFEPPNPEAAIDLTGADGTRSILDIIRIGDTPDFRSAAPVTPPDLLTHFGTAQPTKESILASESFWQSIPRGQARYIFLYDNGAPAQILFAGCAFD